MKKIMTVALVVMMLLGLMVPVFASAAGEKMYVNTARGRLLNLRAEPSLDAKLVKRLKRGTEVTVLQTANETEGWTYVHANGKDGYVMTKFLSSTKPVNYKLTERSYNFKSVTAYKVKAKAVNTKNDRSVCLRVRPNQNAKSIRRLTAGDQLKVIAVGTNWNKVVDLTTGRTGYVASAYTTRI